MTGGGVGPVLATVAWDDTGRERLCGAAAPAPVTFVDAADRAAVERALHTAEVAILRGNAFPAVLAAPALRWVHCDHAGIDGFAPAELLDGRLAVTTSAGRSAPALAEHALLFMLALNARLPAFQLAQRRRVWGVAGQQDLRSLRGKRVLIVGAGHTGCALAEFCSVVGMSVHGFRRSVATVPAGFDHMTSLAAGDRLTDVVPDADVVVLAASLNTSSRHLIGRQELARMKPGAILVNVGRGGLVDQDALIEALRSGALGGAGLDVTEPEPLPMRSRLWRCPNLLLTPHVTPRLEDRTERSVDMVVENFTRFRAGEPLNNQLGPADVYEPPAGPGGPVARRVRGIWTRLARPRL